MIRELGTKRMKIKGEETITCGKGRKNSNEQVKKN